MNITPPPTSVITQCQVFPIFKKEPHAKLLGFARILINDEILLTSMRIYDGTKGPFVAYPIDPHHKGEDYRQLYYPITKNLRDYIEETILAEYNRMMEVHKNENA